jgi:16S rRNA G966 N2-methylase RsmD
MDYYNLEYPYYRLYYKFNKNKFLQLISSFHPEIYTIIPNNIKNKKINKFDSNYFIIKDIFENTAIINNITDYFSEVVRVKCNFKNNPSPYDYWKNNKENIIKMTLDKYKKLNIYNIRETIFFNTRLCNNFRITICLTILNYFKPKTWLDISAGWGDRLISAILYKVKKYVSCDPNINLHPCYDEIKNTFLENKDKKNYIIYKNGFLEAIIPEKDKFDIVFSSPPFFDLEIYSDFSENSVKQYTTENNWTKLFFKKSLIKAYNYLKYGGHMILYMGGEKALREMHKLSNIMEYKGIINWYDKNKNIRKIYVWKKIKKNKINDL